MKSKTLFIILFLIVLAFFFYVHEQVHKQIYEHDGCTNVKIGLDTKGFYTQCNSINYIETQTAQLANSVAEIVGYNLQIIMLLVFIYKLTED